MIHIGSSFLQSNQISELDASTHIHINFPSWFKEQVFISIFNSLNIHDFFNHSI